MPGPGGAGVNCARTNPQLAGGEYSPPDQGGAALCLLRSARGSQSESRPGTERGPGGELKIF
jgi:hypothetical protein